MPVKMIQDFLKLEAASGIILMITAIAAMIIANSPLSPWYDLLLDIPVVIAVGTFEIAKPLLLWINDGLMALFFFLIGLELKREFLEGDLSKPGQVTLPAIGAVGGMVVPALCYAALNYDDPVALNGWAIPTATDIAFALGILAIIGSKVPLQLKVFLTSLAIFDDLGAIIVIAAMAATAAPAAIIFFSPSPEQPFTEVMKWREGVYPHSSEGTPVQRRRTALFCCIGAPRSGPAPFERSGRGTT